MTEVQLQAIKERINNIGDNFQWVAVDSEDVNMAVVETKGLGGYTVGIEMAIEHAEFIANARQDVPALVAEVERLREALKEVFEISKYDGISKRLDNCYIVARKALGGEAHG